MFIFLFILFVFLCLKEFYSLIWHFIIFSHSAVLRSVFE